jgi:hypothetical protein
MASTTIGIPPTVVPSFVQVVQIGLGLYLLPALLVAVVVGAVGALVIAVGQLITDILGEQACYSRHPVGQESLRS